MSKRRRDRGESSDDLIGDLSGNELPEPSVEPVTLSSFASAAYGSRVEPFPELNKNRVKVLLLPIENIFPDLMQPRRAIPSMVRKYWDGKPHPDSMSYLFEMWLKEVNLERHGKAFDLHSYLNTTITERAPAQWTEDSLDNLERTHDIGACEWALLKVINLAASIRRDGLTNPISVVERGQFFTIETGERRWLAFQLLSWYFGNQTSEWSKIPARVMDKLSIWRQATENNARADLNAIAKARQLALILMDLHTQEHGITFRPLELYKIEQLFYAQVADPIQYKIPYGKGELVLNAMGFENKSSIKRYRDLLALPPEVWTMADDFNVPEGVLRRLVNKPIEQQLAWTNLWLDTGRIPDEIDNGQPKSAKQPSEFGKFHLLMQYELQQLQGEFDDLDSRSKQMVLHFLRNLIQSLEQ